LTKLGISTTFGAMKAAAHDAAGHRAEAGLLELRGLPAVELRRHLVPPHGLAGPALDDGHVVQPEREQHRLLEPLIDLPAPVACRFSATRALPESSRSSAVCDRLAHRAPWSRRLLDARRG
jgi:hypothetical protein